MRAHGVEVEPRLGDRVSYEDMGNPRREGFVIEEIESPYGTEFRVEWDLEDTWSPMPDGPPLYGTISDMRQRGWRLVASIERVAQDAELAGPLLDAQQRYLSRVKGGALV